MAARFGIFLNWVLTIAALAIAGLGAVIVFNHKPEPMSQGELLFVALIFSVAAAAWALGRGLRFVLAGPARSNNVADFVERFADKPRGGSHR